MRLAFAVAALSAGMLAAAGSALAGGWATVGLSTPPTTIESGDEWHAEVTVLRHGRTPTDGARPSVTIRNEDGTAEVFRAAPSGEVGHYVATVVFPTSGTWSITVDDGLAATGYGVSQTTAFGAVTAVGPGSDSGGARVPTLPLVLGAIAAVALAVAGIAGNRRLRKPAVASH